MIKVEYLNNFGLVNSDLAWTTEIETVRDYLLIFAFCSVLFLVSDHLSETTMSMSKRQNQHYLC